MNLPELEWQFVYGRVAWAVIAAAVLADLLRPAWRRARPVALGLCLLVALVMALPGEASPAHWLVLAWQWPSGVLFGYCLLRLSAPGEHAARTLALMPPRLAAPIGLAGLVLYLDAIGLLSLGWYYKGFGPVGAPLLALAAAALCVFALIRGHARPKAIILLGAVALFSIARLPTGNLWDALLDPLLWSWAIISLGTAVWRRMARKLGEPAALPDAEPEVAAAHGQH